MGGAGLQTILICDDEQNIRNVLDFTLEAEGYLVISAVDGHQAFELALSETPDLIILDVMMPGSDGFETCRRLKSDPRTSSIPVILLTARNSREDRERGREVQADDFMTKPFSPQRVVDLVQSRLGVPKG
jgi:DNA-binding response OmpR family regulator